MNANPDSFDAVIAYFKAYFPLNSLERDEVLRFFLERKIKRRGFVLQQGDICVNFTFIVSGCLKMYAVDQDGREHNLQFAAENDWMTDLSSFYTEKPSQLYIEAVEPSVIMQIKHSDLLMLYVNYHKFDRNFRIIVEQKFIKLQDRVLKNISCTAEERYQYFVEQYPNLSNRLANTQIASYLGITPEFLSKIRKDLNRKG